MFENACSISKRLFLTLLAGVAFAGMVASAKAAVPALTTVTTFPNANSPYSALVQTRDGWLYGTTRIGGSSSKGSIFRISPEGVLETLHSFNGFNGARPFSAMTEGTDGALYGTTPEGGLNGMGTFFTISTNGEFTLLHSFANLNDGAFPYGKLVQGPDGRFYGTTAGSGFDGGNVFRANGSNGNIVVLHAFTGVGEGYKPYGGLALGADGNFYGTTLQGGTNAAVGYNLGTVFRMTPGGSITTLHTFTGPDGAYPIGGLMQAKDGLLYGMASGVQLSTTSISNLGNIYRIGTNGGGFTAVYAFTGGGDGANPYATLIQGSDGFLYGTTTGGSDTLGSLFKVSTGGAFTTLTIFDTEVGAHPVGGVIQGIDGNLYGTTSTNGPLGGGTVFRYALLAPPFILEHPVSMVATNNNGVVFKVVAGGTTPLTYRWVKGTANVSDSANISGSTTDTLTIHHVTAADAGQYVAIVTNPHGNVPSDPAILQVITIRPAITVTAPKLNARTSNAVVTAAGTASGKLGVDAVYAQLNNEPWVLASTSNSWAKWTVDINPVAGTNFLRIYAADSEGRVSLTNTVKFFHVVSAPIGIHVVGLGTVKPDYSVQELAIGKTYAITARPARGFKFMGWSGSTNFSRATLRFLMNEGLDFTATFADIMKPSHRMLSPRPRQRVTTSTVTLTGKTKDNAPGVSVYYQLNGGEWITPETANSFTNWSAVAELSPGTNIIRSYAIDASNLRSLTNTVPVIYTAQ